MAMRDIWPALALLTVQLFSPVWAQNLIPPDFRVDRYACVLGVRFDAYPLRDVAGYGVGRRLADGHGVSTSNRGQASVARPDEGGWTLYDDFN